MGDQPKIVALAFEDKLVRTIMIDGEPWFVGRDVCRVLEIKNESDALCRLDDDERQDGVAIADPFPTERVGNSDPSRGGRGYATIVSEAGVFRLIFTSRKPEAERFKRWLAHDVLPALRRTGTYTLPGRQDEADPADELPARRASGDHVAELTAKTAAVREARILMGRAFAARVWRELDMPAAGDMRMPLASVSPLIEEEAFAILVDLLSAPDRDGVIIGDQIARAVELKRSDLVEPLGLKLVWRLAGRAVPEGALFVANRAPAITHAFAGTARETDAALRLRDLPGAAAGTARIAAIGYNGRGTVVPPDQLDLALKEVACSPDSNQSPSTTASFVNEVYP
ncbi:BRO-N domain-containing protein [Pleomorphomonas koreensis]|uniref:BRO-N domain-containing protein n=1 Tax=Pleomorphomonas koreensis TaxID=257440 RepID=UPI00040513A6|nr:BRO family protein [Pleomorphomonas koreensis]